MKPHIDPQQLLLTVNLPFPRATQSPWFVGMLS